LAINGDGQVIDIDLQPIPGLYAAGESAGGIGGGVTGSMIVGQIAAEHLTNN
jgi:predicted oxidoreductase